MAHMIKVAKKADAQLIAGKLARTKQGPLYNGYVKDLMKLNYTTLVALVGRVK